MQTFLFRIHSKKTTGFITSQFPTERSENMTLKDIAAEAGVSVSTVSRVINNASRSAASQEVRDHIWEIVRRSGYTPNSSAQRLRKNSIAAVEPSRSLACLFARSPAAITDPFFTTLAHSIEQESYKQNYVLKYSFTSIDIGDPRTYHLITNNYVDGAVILGRCDKSLLSYLKKYFNYVIYVGINSLDARYDQVLCDSFAVTETILDHILSLGHRKIAYIGEVENEERFSAYRRILEENGLEIDERAICNVVMSTDGGYHGAWQLLKKTLDFTAVFCPNDLTALGVLKAFQEAGVRVPQDVSVVSIDNLEFTQYIIPKLTTVNIPLEEMGRLAAKTLIDRITGGHTLPMRILFSPRLVIRESSAPPREHTLCAQDLRL